MYIVRKNNQKKWIVIIEENKRASRVFETKVEAIAFATKRSRDENTTFRVEDSLDKKSKKKLWILLVIVLLVVIAVLVFLFLSGRIRFEKEDPNQNKPSQIVTEGELSIHFLELGNYYAGDSVYIKAGDMDILIDAGSRASSSTTIHNYIKKYCTDGKLEYVIATHAHEDHISGFVGTNSIPGIFDLYECEVIIDYAFKNTTSQISKNYEAKRDQEVTLGAKHYTAKDCMEGANGAKSKYTLTESINFEILNQKYYYEKSSDENNYSVCMMLNYGDNHFLFTEI